MIDRVGLEKGCGLKYVIGWSEGSELDDRLGPNEGSGPEKWLGRKEC